ncbi:hypothetical protein AQUCO_04500063v1, partial [Aquilegia coerulea]
RRDIGFHFVCSSLQFNSQNEGENKDNEKKLQGKQPHVVLVERYSNGTAKRFVFDGDLPVQTSVEEHGSPENGVSVATNYSNVDLLWLPDSVKDFILPAGFPGSVSDDYLEYMLLQFPTNVTAWMCHALVTSSLLKAVGVGSFSASTVAASAAATAAAIRWVSKDGLGAVGRLFIGGRFGNLFDDDPKQWRMYADFVGSAGSIFDLTTPLYPAYFLPLAALGNLAKAVARGLKDPSFRVIQNHFAISGNLGDVAAKEEVWEVAAQLFGLGFGIVLLDAPGLQTSYMTLALTWLSIRLSHLWLRYQSLSVLRFNTINLKRGRILVKSHVSHSTVLGCVDCNREENILTWERFLKPQIVLGASVEEIIGGERSSSMVQNLLKLYTREKYILVVEQHQIDFKVFVSFKVGATSQSVLRSLWQTYWLHEHWEESNNVFDQLAKSLFHLEERFDHFLQLLEEAGWDVRKLKLKVPKNVLVEETGPTDSLTRE